MLRSSSRNSSGGGRRQRSSAAGYKRGGGGDGNGGKGQKGGSGVYYSGHGDMVSMSMKNAQSQSQVDPALDIEDVVKKMMENASVVKIQEEGCCAVSKALWDRKVTPEFVVTSGALAAVLAAMAQHPSAVIVQAKGCHIMHNLCKSDVKMRDFVAEMGGIDRVLAAISNLPDDTDTQSFGCGALWNLSLTHTATVGERGGIAIVLESLVAHPTADKIQEYGVGALSGMMSKPSPVAINAFLAGNGVTVILTAMRAFPANVYVQRNGCLALAYACEASAECHAIFIAAQGLAPVVSALQHHRTNDIAFDNACRAIIALFAFDVPKSALEPLTAEVVGLLESQSALSSQQSPLPAATSGAASSKKILCSQCVQILHQHGIFYMLGAQQQQQQQQQHQQAQQQHQQAIQQQQQQLTPAPTRTQQQQAVHQQQQQYRRYQPLKFAAATNSFEAGQAAEGSLSNPLIPASYKPVLSLDNQGVVFKQLPSSKGFGNPGIAQDTRGPVPFDDVHDDSFTDDEGTSSSEGFSKSPDQDSEMDRDQLMHRGLGQRMFHRPVVSSSPLSEPAVGFPPFSSSPLFDHVSRSPLLPATAPVTHRDILMNPASDSFAVRKSLEAIVNGLRARTLLAQSLIYHGDLEAVITAMRRFLADPFVQIAGCSVIHAAAEQADSSPDAMIVSNLEQRGAHEAVLNALRTQLMNPQLTAESEAVVCSSSRAIGALSIFPESRHTLLVLGATEALLSLFIRSQSLQLSVASAAINALRKVLTDSNVGREKLVQVRGIPLLLNAMKAVLAFYNSLDPARDRASAAVLKVPDAHSAGVSEEVSFDDDDDDDDDEEDDMKMPTVFHDTLVTLGMEDHQVQEPRHSRRVANAKLPAENNQDRTIAISTMEDTLAIFLELIASSSSSSHVASLVSTEIPEVVVDCVRVTPQHCAIQEYGCEILWRLAVADAKCAHRIAVIGGGDVAIQTLFWHAKCAGGHGAQAGALFAACAVLAVVPWTTAVDVQTVLHASSIMLHALHMNVQNGSFVRRATAALVMLLRPEVVKITDVLCISIFDSFICALNWHASNPTLVACICNAFRELIFLFPSVGEDGKKTLLSKMPRLHMAREFLQTLVETMPFVPEARTLLDLIERECPSPVPGTAAAAETSDSVSTTQGIVVTASARSPSPHFNCNAASFVPRGLSPAQSQQSARP